MPFDQEVWQPDKEVLSKMLYLYLYLHLFIFIFIIILIIRMIMVLMRGSVGAV